jgi:hypothetical protein
VVVFIHSARVGMIIGKKGQEVDKLTKELEDLAHRHIEVKTMEVNRPEVDPQLIAEDIGDRSFVVGLRTGIVAVLPMRLCQTRAYGSPTPSRKTRASSYPGSDPRAAGSRAGQVLH